MSGDAGNEESIPADNAMRSGQATDPSIYRAAAG